MPKALTATLSVFDGKSKKFELFADSFRNNIKVYPHLTEVQKINHFHSLLRRNALQAYCNLEDAKKDNQEEVITAFKRLFGDFQPSAKARCEWDALHFDPQNKNCLKSLKPYRNLQKKRPVPKRKSSLTKQYTLKCRITSKRSSLERTSKINRTSISICTLSGRCD